MTGAGPVGRERRAASARGAAAGRSVLVALLLLAPFAWAQDARQTTVQRIARDWLALVDAANYDASWKAAGAKFRLSITPARWTEAVRKVRAPLGPLAKRTMLRTTFTPTFPGVPEGDYALVAFRAAYAKRDDGEETVTLEHEADGAWRVIGYVVH